MSIERINYRGWPNAWRIFNQTIELVVTGDVGPRIIHASFIGEENHLHVAAETAGKTSPEGVWYPYGGHRLWLAPEDRQRTYQPDNEEVEIDKRSVLCLNARACERMTGLRKEMEVRLYADEPCALITHRLRNTGLWPVTLGPWSITQMAAGGTVIAPLPPRGDQPSNLLPTGIVAIWPYTNMADPRFTWGHKCIILRQDSSRRDPLKFGIRCTEGWAAYARNQQLFVKFFSLNPTATYPDMGCNFESFVNGEMLEVESMGPMTLLEPGATVEHVERWVLLRDVQQPNSESDVESMIYPAIDLAKRRAGMEGDVDELM